VSQTDTETGALARGLRPVSFSEISTFRQCPMKWELSYIKGYKPTVEKEAFRLGHIWHEIMQVHYGVIKEYQEEEHGGSTRSPRRGSIGETDLLESCAGQVGYVLDKVDTPTRELMEWAYAGYVQQYGCDPQWKILAIEVRGETPLADGGRGLVWIIDLVVEDLDYGGVWIIDHKFPGDLAGDVELDLHDQLGLYWIGWITFGDPLAQRVNGAMINEARKKRNVGDLPDDQRGMYKNGKLKGTPQSLDQRFRRSRTDRSDAKLAAIRKNTLRVLKAMQLLTDHDALFNSPDPQTCQWKCEYKEPHIFSESIGDPIEEILTDFQFTSRAEREAEEK
jgi:PD-(D/E)XK nuclease superfamily